MDTTPPLHIAFWMEIHLIMTTQQNGAGLFQKGGPGGPGRPKRTQEQREYIAAIKAGFPPEKVLDLMRQALDLAIGTNSWRGVLAVVEFAAAYSLGKPKQQVQVSDGASLSDLLAQVDTGKPLLGDSKPTPG